MRLERKRQTNSVVEWVYSWMICLSLFFHVFNDISLTESIKLFHVPAIIAAIITVFMSVKNDMMFLNICFIAIFTLCGAIVSVYEKSIVDSFKFIITIFSCYGLCLVDKNKIYFLLNIMTPILLLSLILHYYSGIYYRYSGWYNDPNYFCTTLLLLLCSIIYLLRKTNQKMLKLVSFVELIVIIMLVSFSISRSGLLCVSLVLLTKFWNAFKKHFFLTVLVFLLVLAVGIQSGFVENSYNNFRERVLETSDNMEAATVYRFEVSMQGVDYVITHPENLFFGVGIGGTFGNKSIPTKKAWHVDHNTYTSFFVEQGIFVFVGYIAMIVCILKNQIKCRKWDNVIVLLSISIFAISISQKLYLPYWFLIFFLSQKRKCINMRL